MDTLYVNIKQGIRVDIYRTVGSLQDVLGQAGLVGQLDFVPFTLEDLIIGMGAQLGEEVEIGNPLIISDSLSEQSRQSLVRLVEPATGSHSVGLVVELLGPDLIKVPEYL
jgi:hypothetical protein